MKMWLLYVNILVCAYAAKDDDKKPLYTITAPNTIASRSYFTVEVFIHHAHKRVSVTVELQKPDGSGGFIHTFEPLAGFIKPGDGKTFRFKTKLLHSDSYTLKVVGTQGLEFQEQVVIPVNPKKSTTLIQTDKGVYQAGETVSFRVIILDGSLLPLKSLLHVNVYDANGSLVKEFIGNTSIKGVFSNSFELCDKPVLGNWRLEVQNKEEFKHKKDEDYAFSFQKFRVEECCKLPTHIYSFKNDFELNLKFEVVIKIRTLPTFHVFVRTQPTYVTYNQSNILVILEANYASGHAVKGKFRLHIQDAFCVKFPNLKCDAKSYVTEEMNVTGEAVTPVNIVDILDLPYHVYAFGSRDFAIDIVVTEDATQVQKNAKMTVPMHKDPMKVELVPSGAFKPGLPFTQLIRLSYHDNSLVENAEGNINASVQFLSDQEPQYHILPMTATGIVKLDLKIPTKAFILNIEAKYKDYVGFTSVPKAAGSGNYEYIKITQLTKDPEVDKPLNLQIESTAVLESRLILFVIARGDITYVKTFPQPDDKTQLVHFTVHESMAPSMTILVYYVSSCGTLVVDAISVQVYGLFKTAVSLKVNRNETEPGKEVHFEVKTRPRSFVGFLAIDQTAVDLKLANILNEQRVLDDLSQYEMTRTYFYNPLIDNKNVAFPHPWSTAESPLQIFKDAGLIIKTNFLEDEDNLAIPYMGSAVAIDKSIPGDELDELDEETATESEYKIAPREHKIYPEVYFWIDADTNALGKYTVKKESPNSFKKYFISAVVVNEKTGFGLSYPVKLSVSKNYFSSINAPYSVKRGEIFAVQILTYNYAKAAAKVTVTLNNQKKEFSFVNDRLQETNEVSKSVHIKIPAFNVSTTIFNLKASTLGAINLTVTTVAEDESDTHFKTLLVKEEGIERLTCQSFLVDLTKSEEFTKSIELDVPTDLVDDSLSLSISVIGNVLGNAFVNYKKLLPLPEGSGEENLVNFVAETTILNLLQDLAYASSNNKNQVKKYLEKSYQMQLAYLHKDGAFSAFGAKDKSGSMWLTAAVARAFNRAEKYITVDHKVLTKSLKFLTERQQVNGSFTEEGAAYQISYTNGVALTAKILITLLDMKDSKYDEIISKATNYIEKQSNSLENAKLYDVVIATYALHLVNSSEKENFLNALEDKAMSHDGQTHWDIKEDKRNPDVSNSLSIEATAYALLTYIHLDDLHRAMPIVSWLVSQQNEDGGFESTQDSLTAIEALASISPKLTYLPSTSVTLKLNTDNETHSFNVNFVNAVELQSRQFSSTTQEVTATATGNGIAVVQVLYKYYANSVSSEENTEESSKHISGTVKTTLHEVNNRSYDIEVCTDKEDDEEEPHSSSITVMDIEMPSGSVIDHELLPKSSNMIKKVETLESNTRVLIYFESASDICLNVTALQPTLVSNPKSALVKLYDFCEPDKYGEFFYNVPVCS